MAKFRLLEIARTMFKQNRHVEGLRILTFAITRETGLEDKSIDCLLQHRMFRRALFFNMEKNRPLINTSQLLFEYIARTKDALFCLTKLKMCKNTFFSDQFACRLYLKNPVYLYPKTIFDYTPVEPRKTRYVVQNHGARIRAVLMNPMGIDTMVRIKLVTSVDVRNNVRRVLLPSTGGSFSFKLKFSSYSKFLCIERVEIKIFKLKIVQKINYALKMIKPALYITNISVKPRNIEVYEGEKYELEVNFPKNEAMVENQIIASVNETTLSPIAHDQLFLYKAMCRLYVNEKLNFKLMYKIGKRRWIVYKKSISVCVKPLFSIKKVNQGECVDMYENKGMYYLFISKNKKGIILKNLLDRSLTISYAKMEYRVEPENQTFLSPIAYVYNKIYWKINGIKKKGIRPLRDVSHDDVLFLYPKMIMLHKRFKLRIKAKGLHRVFFVDKKIRPNSMCVFRNRLTSKIECIRSTQSLTIVLDWHEYELPLCVGIRED